MTEEQYQEEEKWIEKTMSKVFEVEKFKQLGKEDDYVFQALSFLGEASQKLSLARTILKDNNIAPEMMVEMMTIQQWVHDFKDYLRKNEE